MTYPREDDNFVMGSLAAQDAYRGEYQNWPPSPSYPPDRVDAGNEQLGAIGNTLRRYMTGPADFVRSIPRGMAGGFADAATALGSATAHEMGQPEVAAGMPTGEQGRDLIEQNVTGPLHQPETNLGRYGESFGQVIGNPSNLIGPPVKTALFNLASGIGSEGMGQLYEGTPYEKAARFAGSISPMIAERASAMSRALPQGSVGAFGGKIVQPNAAPGMPMGALAEPQGIRALSMDTAAGMSRAAEQGYIIDAYKGGFPYDWNTTPVRNGKGEIIRNADVTPKELTEFKSSGGDYAGFFSSDPAVASRFAAVTSDQGAVFPTKLKFDNPLVIDAQGKPAAAFQFPSVAREHGKTEEMNAFKSAFEKGSKYDGVILRNTRDEGDVYVPRHSNQVRSRFAVFDPANKESGHILGGIAGAAPAGLGALASQEQYSQ